MATKNEQPTDVSDMANVHQAFRRGFGEARSQLAYIEDGDTERAAFFADYMSEVLWFLHAHHEGEDELLYPRLAERVPSEADLWARMDDQHSGVSGKLKSANQAATAYRASASRSDADRLADECESLWDALGPHLSQEEAEVLPIAADYITPEEWGQLPQHALMHYTGERLWLPFGLATEAFPAEVRDEIVASAPPLSAMWNGGGSKAFDNHMQLIRDSSAWSQR
ncbi:MAG TPA: hemerythrin domain-containing protein [Actinomycetes bacterium]|nr:hemerythrin domain-containing protein [Actinomycetes bacterium]